VTFRLLINHNWCILSQAITAIITDRRGRVLSIGQNSYIKTHPLQAKHAKKAGLPQKQFLHAEIHAITRCKNLSKAHSIMITRYNKNGQPVLAAPCPVCMSAIAATGIKHIEHT
jgi:tRNA(Arg) A34 adenosine deaminase TadA